MIINIACVQEVIIEMSGVTFHCLLFFLYLFLTYFAGIRSRIKMKWFVPDTAINFL